MYINCHQSKHTSTYMCKINFIKRPKSPPESLQFTWIRYNKSFPIKHGFPLAKNNIFFFFPIKNYIVMISTEIFEILVWVRFDTSVYFILSSLQS